MTKEYYEKEIKKLDWRLCTTKSEPDFLDGVEDFTRNYRVSWFGNLYIYLFYWKINLNDYNVTN